MILLVQFCILCFDSFVLVLQFGSATKNHRVGVRRTLCLGL